MSLQKTIYNAIKRNGKPATVTWQASTALDQRAPKKGTVETVAYEATVKAVTQSGAIAYEKRIYLPVLERSIVGATITIGSASWKVITANVYEAGSRSALMQEASVK